MTSDDAACRGDWEVEKDTVRMGVRMAKWVCKGRQRAGERESAEDQRQLLVTADVMEDDGQ